MSRRAIVIHRDDNVANVLEDVAAGEEIAARLGGETVTITAGEAIPFGFKVALRDLEAGAEVVKYGETIGVASQPIGQGTLVHVHNLAGGRGRGDLAPAASSSVGSDR